MTDAHTQEQNDLGLVGGWLADIRGTHIGTAYMLVHQKDGELLADLHIKVDGRVSTASGKFSSDRRQIEFTESTPPASTQPTVGHIFFGVSTPGTMWGRWKTAEGAAGTVTFTSERVTQPAPLATQSAQGAPASVRPAENGPLQVIISEYNLGPITISNAQIRAILDRLQKAIPISNGTHLSVSLEGRTIRRYEDAWFSSHDLPTRTDNIFLQRNENTSGIQKVITIQLSQKLGNRIIVQSADEHWSAGVALSLKDFFAPYTAKFSGWVKATGIQSAILVLAVAITMFTPDFPKGQRAVFLAVMIILAGLLGHLRERIGRTRILLVEAEPGWLERHASDVVTGIISTVVGALFLSVLSYVGSTDFADRLTAWWQSLRM